MRFLIRNGYEVVASYEKTLIQGQKQVDEVAYLNRDALGTVTAVSNSRGILNQTRLHESKGSDSIGFVELKGSE